MQKRREGDVGDGGGVGESRRYKTQKGGNGTGVQVQRHLLLHFSRASNETGKRERDVISVTFSPSTLFIPRSLNTKCKGKEKRKSPRKRQKERTRLLILGVFSLLIFSPTFFLGSFWWPEFELHLHASTNPTTVRERESTSSSWREKLVPGAGRDGELIHQGSGRFVQVMSRLGVSRTAHGAVN